MKPEEVKAVVPNLQMPIPRVALGMELRKIAHAALDLSDGLMGDLNHILDASNVGATINVDALPHQSGAGKAADGDYVPYPEAMITSFALRHLYP